MAQRNRRLTWRLALLMFALLVGTGGIVVRLVQVQIIDHDYYTAQADEEHLHRTVVRAPREGQVLKLHARPGVYAVAEVYETDITRVRPGQRARIRSAALPGGLAGTVERVGLQVVRLTSLGTDSTMKTDARVVEVEIRLAESAAVPSLTNLEVEILIEV